MAKKHRPSPRDIQARHRLSGAAMLGSRGGSPPEVAAVDAAPRAGDVPLRGVAFSLDTGRTFGMAVTLGDEDES